MQTSVFPSKYIVGGFITLLVMSLAFVYGPFLSNSFVNLDDDMLLEKNQTVRGLTTKNVALAFTTFDPELYVPLTMLSYQVEYSLAGGLSPTLIHADNLVLHALSALLVAWVLFLLFEDALLAAVCGLVFALHPLNVEAILWASARKDVLASAFGYASIVAYIVSKKSGVKKWFFASLALFACALLSKVSVLMLPVVFLLADWVSKGQLSKNDWREKAPFFLLSFAFGAVALFAKSQPFAEIPFTWKVLLAPISTVFYLEKFVLPIHLSVLYPFSGSPSAFVCGAAALLLIGLFGCAWAYRSHSKVPLAGFCVFFILLAPTFLNAGRGGELYFASDRYAYLPMLGLLMILGHALSRLVSASPRAIMSGALGTLIVFAWVSAGQAMTWSDSGTMNQNVLAYYPYSFAARNNLGLWYMNEGKLDLAKHQFEEALKIHASDKATVNLAAATELAGDPHQALELLKPALSREHPSSDAFLTAGNAYKTLGSKSEAEASYRKAISAAPDIALAYNNLGVLYLSEQNWLAASDVLREAIHKNASTADVFFNYGIALEQLGATDEAISAYAMAASLKQDDTEALANLATLLVRTQKNDQAASILRSLLSLDPENTRGKTLLKLLEK